ncbi:MAG: imidazole glycerol phosphate synthase subunit HisF [bacterium]
MLAKRIVPCLDVKDGRVVKGIQFENLRDAGDPVELAKFYVRERADELVFLDISASIEKRPIVCNLVERIAEEVFIPFTIGGGLKAVEDIREILSRGADKIALNTAAVAEPELISKAADSFGSQCVVVAMDIKRDSLGTWRVYTHGGTKASSLEAVAWAVRVCELGAGEILLTSIEKDGSKTGFDLEVTSQISQRVSIPVIASGGGGELAHFYDVFTAGQADAALAASIFHFGEIRIADLKSYLKSHNIPIRN